MRLIQFNGRVVGKIKLADHLVQSNVYIALAAGCLTIQSQIQLGMHPQWHPYLFIIFFATLFEYNVHRLITVMTNKDALYSEKHRWVRENLTMFYILVAASVSGFILVVALAKKEVLIALAPVAVLTLLYSIPVFGIKRTRFRLREIPYLKIFMIAFVWSYSTIILPVVQSGMKVDWNNLLAMMAERFLFIFAITIPFDIRDMEVDQRSGLKTIPLAMKDSRSWVVAYLALFLFFIISAFHYLTPATWFIFLALSVSAGSTGLLLSHSGLRKRTDYHHGLLDGTMILQGILVVILYYLIK